MIEYTVTFDIGEPVKQEDIRNMVKDAIKGVEEIISIEDSDTDAINRTIRALNNVDYSEIKDLLDSDDPFFKQDQSWWRYYYENGQGR